MEFKKFSAGNYSYDANLTSDSCDSDDNENLTSRKNDTNQKFFSQQPQFELVSLGRSNDTFGFNFLNEKTVENKSGFLKVRSPA